MLYALADNIDFQTWKFWPSKKTIASAAGYSSVRTVDDAITQLVGLGILTAEHASRGGVRPNGQGLTSVYQAQIEVLESLSSAHLNASNPAIRDTEPRKPRHQTPHGLRGNRPSIHNKPEEQLNHAESERQMQIAARRAGWMDGKDAADLDVRGILAQIGVRGPNLDVIATAPGITVAEIREEVKLIRKDPRVRNVAAVLVKRVNKRHDLGLPGRVSASAADLKANDQLMRLRARQRALSKPADPVAQQIHEARARLDTSVSRVQLPSPAPTSEP